MRKDAHGRSETVTPAELLQIRSQLERIEIALQLEPQHLLGGAATPRAQLEAVMHSLGALQAKMDVIHLEVRQSPSRRILRYIRALLRRIVGRHSQLPSTNLPTILAPFSIDVLAGNSGSMVEAEDSQILLPTTTLDIKANADVVASTETAPISGFDIAFYRRTYLDVGMTDIDLAWHFQNFGRAEGRLGQAPVVEQRIVERLINPKLRTVLVVSHEASRSGSPILALNTVIHLQKHYNVVAVLLGDGEITEAFEQTAAATAGPYPKQYRLTPYLNDVLDSVISRFKPIFAIAHCIESEAILGPLNEAGIPCIFAIHEFASYIRPLSRLRNAFVRASRIVFPAENVWRDALAFYPSLARISVELLTQGKSVIPLSKIEYTCGAEPSTNNLIFDSTSLKSQSCLKVLGCGSVEYRKGVDLFLAVASSLKRAAPELDFRFVWVGRGYKPLEDTGYSSFLAAQLQRSGLSDDVFFLDEVSNLEAIYDAADVLLLTSRFDPYPNVAIDAMVKGLPVVCFAEASGVASTLQAESDLRFLVVPDSAADMAAEVLHKLAEPAIYSATKEKIVTLAEKRFDMEAYVHRLFTWGNIEIDNASSSRAAAKMLASAPAFNPEFYEFGRVSMGRSDATAVLYAREWVRGLPGRRAMVGFDATRYSVSPAAAGQKVTVPLVDFLAVGQPAGQWIYPVIDLTAETNEKLETNPKSLLVLTAASFRNPHQIADAIKANTIPLTIVPFSEKCGTEEQREILVKALSASPHRFDDLDVRQHNLSHFDCICLFDLGRLTDKKYEWEWWSRLWQKFFFHHLLGGSLSSSDVIATCFASDNELQIVVAECPDREVRDAQPGEAWLAQEMPEAIDFAPRSAHGVWMRSALFQQWLRSSEDTSGAYPHQPMLDGVKFAAVHIPSMFERRS